MIPIIGFIIGIIAGLAVQVSVDPSYSKYIAMGILAAVDTVIGGIYANVQKNFDQKVFITGFVSNVVMAALLTYMGSRIDVDLSLAAIVVFGSRIFNNLAMLRRILVNKYLK